MHMAFFPSDKAVEEPEYEMTVELLANGVARSLALNYGDFTVEGKLVSIQALPQPKCK